MYKIITLNIEGTRHLDTVIPFLQEENADIICLQELYKPAVSILNQVLGDSYTANFEPLCLHNDNGRNEMWDPIGIAIFSRVPIRNNQIFDIYVPKQTVVRQEKSNIRETTRTLLQSVTLDDDDHTTICNTHFTWSARGEATENQRVDVNTLIEVLNRLPHFILCGDFNIPRGNIHYRTLATHLTDHVPTQFTCSLDMSMHRSRHDPVEKARVSEFMVDYIFSKPNTYSVEGTTQHCSVSDHCGFSALIEKMV